MNAERAVAYLLGFIWAVFVLVVVFVFTGGTGYSLTGGVFVSVAGGVAVLVFRLLVLAESRRGRFALRVTDEGLRIGAEIIVPWGVAGCIETENFGLVRGTWVVMRFDDMEACRRVLPVRYVKKRPLGEDALTGISVGLVPTYICDCANILERERWRRKGASDGCKGF